jgi:hypothetical protein
MQYCVRLKKYFKHLIFEFRICFDIRISDLSKLSMGAAFGTSTQAAKPPLQPVDYLLEEPK